MAAGDRGLGEYGSHSLLDRPLNPLDSNGAVSPSDRRHTANLDIPDRRHSARGKCTILGLHNSRSHLDKPPNPASSIGAAPLVEQVRLAPISK